MRLYTFIFFIIVNIYNSQNLQIIYEVVYKPIKNEAKTESELMALDIKNNSSIFYSYAKIKSDSIYKKINSANESDKIYLRSIVPSESFNKVVIKRNDDNVEDIIERFNAEYYEYRIPFVDVWKILNSKKVIKKYNCNAARINYGGRTWEAWYSEDIPIQDGPFQFRGLPGLILEIYSIDGDYNIKVNSIETKDSTFKIPKQTIKIDSSTKLMKIKKDYVREPSAKSKQEDMMSGFSGDAIINGIKSNGNESYKFLNKELWDWMKKHNNPIEKGDIWVK